MSLWDCMCVIYIWSQTTKNYWGFFFLSPLSKELEAPRIDGAFSFGGWRWQVSCYDMYTPMSLSTWSGCRSSGVFSRPVSLLCVSNLEHGFLREISDWFCQFLSWLPASAGWTAVYQWQYLLTRVHRSKISSCRARGLYTELTVRPEYFTIQFEMKKISNVIEDLADLTNANALKRPNL